MSSLRQSKSLLINLFSITSSKMWKLHTSFLCTLVFLHLFSSVLFCLGQNETNPSDPDWNFMSPLIKGRFARAAKTVANELGSRACRKSEFRCDDGTCIRYRLVCDKEENCPDGTDEAPSECEDEPQITTTSTTTTPRASNCPRNGFECGDGSCIRRKLLCDKEDDCEDGSDESPALCSQDEEEQQVSSRTSLSASAVDGEAEKPRVVRLNNEGVEEAEEESETEAPEDFPVGSRADQDDEIINEAQKLVQAGDEHVKDDARYRDIILMAGNSGAGKSTLAKILTVTDVKELESLWVGERFIIKDREGRISSQKSAVVSKSIFPKLMLDEKKTMAFFDLPGFGDTRGSSVEIGNADFIKRVADRARRVKIVLVVNFSSLKSGEIRTDFINLIRSVVEYVKDQEKYRPAIALIANKVDIDMATQSIVPAVAQFIKDAKDDLPQIMQDDPLKKEQIQILLDTLLIKDRKGDYARIGYFKQPDRAGLLSEIPDAQSAKLLLTRIIKDNLNFVMRSSEDFGFSFLPSTRLFIAQAVTNLQNSIYQTFQELTSEILKQLNSKTGSDYSILSEYKQDLEFLKNRTTAILQLSKGQGQSSGQGSSSAPADKNQDLTDFFSIFQDISQQIPSINLDLEVLEPIDERVRRHIEQLMFLEPYITIKRAASDLGSGVGARTRRGAFKLWASPLQLLVDDTEVLIYEKGQAINEAILSTFGEVTDEVIDMFIYKQEPIKEAIAEGTQTEEEIEEIQEDLTEDAKTLKTLVDDLVTSSSSSSSGTSWTIQGFLNKTAETLTSLRVGVLEETIDKLNLPLEEDLSLADLELRPSPFTPFLWLSTLEKVIDDLHRQKEDLVSDIAVNKFEGEKSALMDAQGPEEGDQDGRVETLRSQVEEVRAGLLTVPKELQEAVERERELVENSAAASGSPLEDSEEPQ